MISTCQHSACASGMKLARILPRVGLGMLSVLCLVAFTGCGVGGLIGAAVAGAVLALEDDSSPEPVARVTLASPPGRKTLRDRGDPSQVPVCFMVTGADPEDVQLQYELVAEAASDWQDATVLAAPPPGPSLCPAGASTLWWDAAADLALEGAGRSVEVRVRAFAGDDPRGGDESQSSFFVGNTPPSIEFLAPSGNRGQISIFFAASDGEEDALRDVRLSFEIPGEPERELRVTLPCASSDAPSCTLPLSRNVTLYTPQWDSRGISDADGRLVIEEVRLILRGRDAFGLEVEEEFLHNLDNNHPPDVAIGLVGNLAELDSNFEIPIAFELFDEDPEHRDNIDVIVQYALNRGQILFPEPGPLFDDALCRRAILGGGEAPGCDLTLEEIAELRREFQIATPSPRRPESRAVGLSAGDPSGSEEGVRHVFLWDTTRDVSPLSSTPVTVRIIPYDVDGKGNAREGLSSLDVDNNLFPTAVRLGSDPLTDGGVPRGSCDDLGMLPTLVAAAALGDVDKDGRLDVALSLPEAPAYPDAADAELASRLGRVDVFLRNDDGSLPDRPSFSVVPGRDGADPSPGDLILSDVDLDGCLDLLVLDSYCGRCTATCAERGDISVFYGAEGPAPFATRPDELLVAGLDVQSMAVGDVDGEPGLDVAVANHDPSDAEDDRPSIGVFLTIPGSRGFTCTGVMPCIEATPCMACFRWERKGPTQLICADFKPEAGSRRDEIAFVDDVGDGVVILHWDPGADGPLAPWAVLPVTRPASLQASDFDGNRFVDLVVGSGTHNDTLSYFRAIEAGTGADEHFASCACTEFFFLDDPDRLLAADLTANGVPELIALEADGDRIELATLDGGRWRVFHSLTRVSLPASGSEIVPSVAAGDIDGDGGADLVVGTSRGAAFYRAQPAGSLAPELVRSFEIEPLLDLRSVFPGDFNDDRSMDLATAFIDPRAEAYGAALFYQDRLGNFPPQPSAVLRSAPLVGGQGFVRGAALFTDTADLDADGSPDLIVVSRPGGIDFFLKRGAPARWGAPEPGLGYSLPDGTLEPGTSAEVRFRLGEFDGEEGLDVLWLEDLRRRAVGRSVLGRSGEEPRIEFGEPFVLELDPDLLPNSFDSGDLDGDGLLDLAVFHISGNVHFWRQRESGAAPRFEKPKCAPDQDCPPLMAGPVAASIQLRNLDGDAFGRFELLVVSQESDELIVASGELGSFQPALLESVGSPESVAVGDLNGDSRLDIAVSTSRDDKIRIFYQSAAGPQLFPRRPSWAVPAGSGGGGSVRLAIGDVSGDSRPDLILLDTSTREIRIVRTR